MILAPCKNCSKRYFGCHSRCPEYQAFKEAIEKAHETRRKEQIINSHEYDVSIDKLKSYKYKYGIKRR